MANIPMAPSIYDTGNANNNTSSIPMAPSIYDQDTTTTEPSQSQTIIKDEDDLDTNQKWLSNASTIYEAEEGDKWQGSQKGLSDWFKDRHSK